MSALTAAKPRPSDLDLCESIGSATVASPMRDDGTIDIHIIRPGIGKGKGRHYYSPDMLRENAHVFSGWKVYIDHLSEEAKKAAGGLPRSFNDLGGMIQESWWDESVPADGEFEQGAVMGKLKPFGQLKEAAEHIPEAVEFSIKAKATGVEPGHMKGGQVWIVEGINDSPPGSVDVVTEAGAGGRIANLIESLDAETCIQEAVDLGLLEETFKTPTCEYRMGTESDALNSILEARAGGDHEEVRLVEAAARERYPDLTKPLDGTDEGENVATIAEALADPESAISKALDERIQARAEELIESKVEAAREEGRKEAQSEAEQKLAKRDLHEEASRIIEESKLPEPAKKSLTEKYGLEETTLDVTDEVDGEGKVLKSAMDQLRESVNADVESQRELVAELAPTKVTGQGSGEIEEGASGEDTKKTGQEQTPYWQEVLQENGFDKPSELYELQS